MGEFQTLLYSVFLFLQVLFAFIPPPSYLGGWLTFILSLVMIGILTTIVGDMASIFGCLVGLSDLITAITFVALGTRYICIFVNQTIHSHWSDGVDKVQNTEIWQTTITLIRDECVYISSPNHSTCRLLFRMSSFIEIRSPCLLTQTNVPILFSYRSFDLHKDLSLEEKQCIS